MPRICCVPIRAPGPVSGRMAPILIVSARAAAIVNAQPNSTASTKPRMDRFSRFSRAGLGAALMRVKAVAGLAPRRYFCARITHASSGALVFMSKHVVATVSEIPPGQRKLVTVRGRSIAVFNLDGEFYGFFNWVPPYGGALGGRMRTAV